MDLHWLDRLDSTFMLSVSATSIHGGITRIASWPVQKLYLTVKPCRHAEKITFVSHLVHCTRADRTTAQFCKTPYV